MQAKLQYVLRLLAILAINLCVLAMVGYAYYTRNQRQQAMPVLSQSYLDGPLSGIYREGDRGHDVLRIQRALAEKGFYSGSIEGVYGTGTTRAVKKFQRSQGLDVDGITGPETLRALGLGETSGGAISDSDYLLLARLVSAESRGEPYEGQVAVAAVILNRTLHPSFPDTIPGVAYQAGEFSAVFNGQMDEPVANSAYRAAKDALNGADPTGGALYYYNPIKTDHIWLRSRPVMRQIGGHSFCA